MKRYKMAVIFDNGATVVTYYSDDAERLEAFGEAMYRKGNMVGEVTENEA